jgi:hypothetical protein
MTGESSQPHGESFEYTPTFNLDGMSIEEAVTLVSSIENSYDPLGSAEGPALRMKEALSEDLSRYPSANIERGLALFAALSESDDGKVRAKAALNIGGLLRAAFEQAKRSHDDSFHKAFKICFDLVFHEDEVTQGWGEQGLSDAVERQELPPETTAQVVLGLVDELRMVHGGETEPHHLSRRRQS